MYSSSQKSAIQQFTSFTNATDRTAAKYLKQHSWNVEVAADSYFHSGGAISGGGQGASTNAVSINKIFDQYKQPGDGPDQMTIAGVMDYFTAIGVSLEDPTVLAVSEALNSPAMGELTRTGFADGWKSHGCDTIEKMRGYVPQLRASMGDEATFKRIYLWTYTWARPEGQKSVPLDMATEWWNQLFVNRFAGHLPTWLQFLEEKWNKSVPKDTWNMLYDFLLFAEKDPSLDTFDEEGAWPSVIDGYVEWFRKRKA